MKRSLIILFVLSVTSIVSAQIKHEVGFQVGFNQTIYRLNTPISKYNIDGDPSKLHQEPLNGIKIGFIYDVTLVKGFGLSTSFNYSYGAHTSKWEPYPYDEKGQLITFDPKYDYRHKAESHRLELALNMQYKFTIADDTYIMLYTGPAAQFVAKYNATDFFQKHDDFQPDLPDKFIGAYGYNADEMEKYFKRWNVTWGIGAGFQYDRYFIRGGYSFGLVNPYQYNSFGDMEDIKADLKDPRQSTHGRMDQWEISVGIYFWQSDK